jgi:nucleoside-diphosphate-sugar epimerase
MMASALIGHTGLVGGTLARRRRFDECYNSATIEQIAGRSFDLVVCAGAPAEKWKANREPAADRRNLDRLWTNLKGARAGKVVLISTIDVYARPVGVAEEDDVDAEAATPYGRHRHELERRVADHFDVLVIRLPGLFGAGLKKNVIYDFLHDNNLDQVDRRSVYQFYPLARLWPDIEAALRGGLRLVNFATEPVSVGEVARDGFGFTFDHELAGEPARYDFRTRHDRLFGGSGGYLLSRSQVLEELRSFVAADREERRCA